MVCVRKEAILLLFLYTYHAQCRTVLETQNINETDRVMTLNREASHECDCSPNGTCRFENGQKKCECNSGFSFKDGICTATCSNDQDCENNQKCEERNGQTTCVCADGLSGDNCEKNEWCEDTGKFKNCKGENGTCEYSKEKRSVDCICASVKKLHPSENRCKDTCTSTDECKNFGICDGNFCQCRSGIIGNNCETVFDCTIHGRFRGCEISGGQCKYDGKNTLCVCPVNRIYHDTQHFCIECNCGPHGICAFENGNKRCYCPSGFEDKDGICTECNCGPNGICRFENGLLKCDCDSGFAVKDGRCTATCSQHEDCKDNQKCVIKDGWNTCECADGLSGENCEKNYWCEGTGKFKNCNGKNGTCEYNKEKRSVDCICASGKSLHPSENRCRDTCTYNSECKNFGTCEGNFCWCRLGVIGDKCETVFDCTIHGIYKGCEISGGKCTYDANYAVCKCPANENYDDTQHFCKECNCGPSGTCAFENGYKKCYCDLGFADKNGICVECNCGPYGSCSFERGQKKCDCKSLAIEKNGVCVVIETTSSEGTSVVTSTVLPSTPQVRESTPSEDKTAVTSTILSSTPPDCDCGENSKSCHFNWKGNKLCNCSSGYAQVYGFCYDCNCGVNSFSCFYRRNGTKVCSCNFGYNEVNGYCTAICSEDKCVHGKCEIIGNGFKCRCNEGFTGQRCEEKIQTKSNKQDLWKILHVSVIFATFILLSGVLCSMIRILNKLSNK